jgi:hypothetical protein
MAEPEVGGDRRGVAELVVVELGAGEVGLLADGASSVWVSRSQMAPSAAATGTVWGGGCWRAGQLAPCRL